jgi:hypothetical protein
MRAERQRRAASLNPLAWGEEPAVMDVNTR